MRYWKRVDEQGNTTTVESYSHSLDVEGAIEITQQEHDDFIASIPKPEPEPPRSTHVSVLTAVNASAVRPATIKRVWEGNDYFFDCFVTQTVRDEYVEGKIVIGDFVLVHFDDVGEQCVTAKVFKSW